jgi:hypothetical protein
MNKRQVFEELKKLGVAQAVIAFSGGGDSGGCESITLLNAEGKDVAHELEEDEGLGEALCKPIYDRYYSFAGEFYVDGRLTWTVEGSKVEITGNESVTDYESIDCDLSDEEE